MILTLSELVTKLSECISSEKSCFKQKQLLRMKSIYYAKNAGDILIRVRELLVNASEQNPIETDIGVFCNFKEFYLQQGLKKATVYRYIKLAENWDIVVKLGMQDQENAENLGKCMRLMRTLRIIDWYLEQVAAGRPEESLTLEQYWLDEEAAAAARQESSQARHAQQEDLAQQLSTVQGELFLANQKLKELDILKQKVKELDILNQELEEAQILNLKLEEDIKQLRIENFKLRNGYTLATS